MGILKRKIRTWRLPLITVINYRTIIINSYYNYIILYCKIIRFPIKTSSRIAIRKNMCK